MATGSGFSPWATRFFVDKIYLSVLLVGMSCGRTEAVYFRQPFPVVCCQFALGRASCLLRRARTDFTSSAVQEGYTVFTGKRQLEILRCLNSADYMFSDLVKVVVSEMMLMRF